MRHSSTLLTRQHFPLAQFEVQVLPGYSFTARELECMNYLLCDYSVKEIAGIFSVTNQAIYKMRERMMDKAGFYCFEGLTGWMFQKGIVRICKF